MFQLNSEFVLQYSEDLLDFLNEHFIPIIVISVISGIIGLFYYLAWWEVIGLIILKFGLGVKVHGAKSFAVAVAKSGGKKALLLTTSGVLLKRHIIDISTKFFAEHSVSRYKHNIGYVVKIKLRDIKNSTLAKKLKALGAALMSIPLLYAFWTKVLGTAIQKFLYAVAVPLFAILWEFLLTGFNFLAGMVSFVFQVTLLNYFVKWLESYRLGKWIIKFMFETVKFLGNLLDIINDVFVWIGFDPKHKLIMYSLKFNRWLESIILKELNGYERVKRTRKMHMTSRELLVLKRQAYKERKVKKISFTKRTKDLFRKKVLKKKTWQEKRKERK